MTTDSTSHVNPWLALKISGARAYIFASVVVVSLSFALSMFSNTWGWLPRCGGVLLLFGVLLSLRRLFRLGPQRFDEPTEPIVINQNQFNMKAVRQDVQRAGDNFAQLSGVALMMIGTLLASYPDLLLDWLLPFSGK
jgi:hypothetical protein